MLSLRAVASVALVVILCFVAFFFWTFLTPGAGTLDAVAVRRITHLCGFHTQCKVQLGYLFDGDWDTFYEFSSGVSQAQLNETLGTTRIEKSDLQRTLVFTREQRLVKTEYEKDGVERMLDGEVTFDSNDPTHQSSIRLTRDRWLLVHVYPVDSANPQRGSYYLLTPTIAPDSEQ